MNKQMTISKRKENGARKKKHKLEEQLTLIEFRQMWIFVADDDD